MPKTNKFGAFGGVFTPSILTILGVIMYMRLPMIVGQAGLYTTIGIILIAHIISVSTGLSVSSIATDKKVKAGGTYYIISRSLGLPIGGTLGLALFVGLSFSVSLYLIGFAESFLGFWGFDITIDNIRIAGTLILLTVTIITFISTSLAVKTQYIIMAAIALSLVSIFLGKHDFVPEKPNFSGMQTALPAMVLFGIFFPAVTGFEAGVSMSGDLKDPKRAIPKGTIIAIAIGLVVYIFLTFFYSYTVDRKVLAEDPNVLLKISRIPALVVAGIWGATLSSALGSILAAPRILQATAVDKITHRFFAQGSKAANEPRNALLLTFLIAEGGILIGQLDVIARIVSIFFITTYGFLNLSCAFEAKTSPDFRPDFKVPFWVSLIGAMACILVMIQLDFLAMIGAIVILGLVFLYIKRKQLTLESGDAWSSVWASVVKTSIQKMNRSSLHSRNWRPNIIMFSGDTGARPHLVQLGKDMTGKHGMITGFELEPTNKKVLIKNTRNLTTSEKSTELLFHKHQCRNIYSGVDEIIRTYGFAGVEPNTVLLGWSKKPENKEFLIKNLELFARNNFNTVFLRYDPVRKFGENHTIDIWWNGWENNITFSIYLIRHLTSESAWKDARVRLFVINSNIKTAEKTYKTISVLLNQYRANIDLKVIDNSLNKYPKEEIISRESSKTDLTIIGFPWNDRKQIDAEYESANQITELLGSILFINASNSFEQLNLGLEKSIFQQKKAEPEVHELALPESPESKYQAINNNLTKLETNGKKVLELFYLKTFAPFFSEKSQIVFEMEKIIRNVFNQFLKASGTDDLNRKQKMFKKGKSEFYYHIMQLLKNQVGENIEEQKDTMLTGIDWYINKLENDISLVPQRLMVDFNKEDYKLKKDDSSALKFLKIRKKTLHPFARKSISSSIPFRKVAVYYLRDNRLQFLEALLKKFYEELNEKISDLRPLMAEIENQIKGYEEKLQTANWNEELIADDMKRVLDSIAGLSTELADLEERYKNRILVEFMKNLGNMKNDMEQVGINSQIQKRLNKKQFNIELIASIKAFPEHFHNSLLFTFNKIYLDVSLEALKSRVKEKIDLHLVHTKHSLRNGLFKKLSNISQEIEKIIDQPELNLKLLKVEIENTNGNNSLIAGFEKTHEEMFTLSNDLPESLIFGTEDQSGNEPDSNQESELITIPVRKIAMHYFETVFINSMQEYLSKKNAEINKIIFQSKDHLSFARFSLENISKNEEDKDQIVKSVMRQTLQKIASEQTKTRHIIDDLDGSIYMFLNSTFDPLYSYKILESANRFSGSLNEYKSKKVLNRFQAEKIRIKHYIRKSSAWLLYSKSEGVLLAKQLIEENQFKSPSEKILDFVDSVTPKKFVLDKLPYYYKNLFSGRSSIGEDFWISRNREEELFGKAVNRFYGGINGGILQLGERNSGKTAFCRYVTTQHFSSEKIYHIFPPRQGSVSSKDFLEVIVSITGINESLEEILKTLPYGCALVFHDVELWWERSSEGYAIIDLIAGLMDNYSGKHLFVLNMNPFAFRIINKTKRIEDKFLYIGTSLAFDSEDIKEMIMRRHRSSGIKFRYGKRNEEQMSDFRLARLFNQYFDSSQGNPGVALNRWLTNINSYSGDLIRIHHPLTPKLDALKELEDNWFIVLTQFVLHKRLTTEKLTRIMQLPEEDIQKMIISIKRTGLIEEKSEQVFAINMFAEPYVLEVLKEKGLL